MKKSLFTHVMTLSILLVCLFLLPTKAQAASVDDLTFALNSDGTYFVSDCNTSTTGEMVIPETYNGKPVTGIGDEAFYNCTILDGIIIPDSVTTIGNRAFFECNSLTGITIPDSVTSIGDGVFRNCISLISITIPDSITSIGSHAFDNCMSLTSITIPNRVTSIGSYAFDNCTSLTSITIPDSVTSIGTYAFSKCTSLTNVTIGNGVTSIGSYTFNNCKKLKDVYITDPSAWCKIPFNTPDANPMYYATNLHILDAEGKEVTEVILDNSVTVIQSYAFKGCTNLTSITIPDSVTSIGSAAFRGCSSLESITIPFVGDSRKTTSDLNQYPFGYIFGTNSYPNCFAVTQYYYGSNTSFTASSTYFIPSKLRSVTVTGGNILYNAFGNCTSLTSITIGSGVTSIDHSAFYNCTSLKEVHISDMSAWCQIAFSSYSSNPLYYAKNLYLNGVLVTDVVIPDGTAKIGNHAFYNCTSLTGVTIPDSVTGIGDGAFYNCTSLTSITIPDNVTSIGYEAFGNCTGLTSISIPAGVTTIEDGTFSNCTNLSYLILPKEMDTIMRNAFSGCSGLKKVYHKGDQTDWDQIVIKNGNDALYNATIIHNFSGVIPGDVDGDMNVTRNDVIKLLLHVTMPIRFPLDAEADFNGDGQTTREDVIKLLLHVTMPNRFPLEVQATAVTNTSEQLLCALPVQTSKQYV